ncbi:MAG: tetratricopeptide repeat protein, partial [Planctomycetota bacterium]
MEGDIFGTPAYMPPEQAAGKVGEIDPRSDVFALGAILYKILTHEAPYTGPSVTEVLRKAMRGEFMAPRVKSPWLRIPGELQSICLKAMRWKKEERYGSVEELVDDVRAYQDHRPVRAHRYGILSRFVRMVRRHPAGSLAGGVALVLISLGGAATGMLLSRAQAIEAREVAQAARADAEAIRADLERRRADEAEVQKGHALDRAKGAEDALEKGRKVSAVLRAADLELGDVVEALRRSVHSTSSEEEKRRTGEKYWPRVEAFCATVARDPASEAAMLAVKGMLQWFAGDSKAAVRIFRRSARADPDVAYGPLFEGMFWLTQYIEWQPLPKLVIHFQGVEFGDMPPETKAMKGARERFEVILETVAKKPIWGETSSEEFREVLDGFRAMQRGDLDTAERGLTKALGVTELAWISREIFSARAKVRLYKKDFQGGRDDTDKVLEFCRESQHPHFFKGYLWFAEGKTRGAKGEDPRPFYRKAIREYDEALRLKSGNVAVLNNRSLTYMYLGEVEDERGGDAGECFRRAIEDASTAVRLDPETEGSYVNRGYAYLHLGDWQSGRGRDPRDAYRRAIAELTEALRRNPDLALARHDRAIAYFRLGETLTKLREDPREWLEKSISDCEEILRKNPNHLEVYCQRAATHAAMGDFARSRREDPSPWYRKALADCKEALKRDPDHVLAHYYSGIAHRKLARAAPMWGRDAREDFERAVESFENVLKRAPRTHMYCELGVTYVGYGEAQKAWMEDPRTSWRKAVEACTEALRGNPEDTIAYFHRAKALDGIGRVEFARGGDPESGFRKAIEDYRQTLRRRPRQYIVHNDLGTLYHALGNALVAKGADPRNAFQGGIETLENARKSFPSIWEISVNLGSLLERVGRHGEAVRMYEEALRRGAERSPA